MGANDYLENDAGLVYMRVAAIKGHAWNDDDNDGLQRGDEERLPGVEMRLERKYIDGAEAPEKFGWLLPDGAPGSDLDEEGEPLEKAERYDPNAVAPEPEPDLPVIPDEPTAPEPGERDDAPGIDAGETPSEGGPSTGEGSGEGVEAAAPLADVNEPDQSVDGDGPVEPTQPGDTVEPEAPSVPEAPATPDAPADSETPAEPEAPKANEWEVVAVQRTDEEGSYSFENLPVIDDEGRAYCYRVVADRPDESKFVPADEGENDNIDNDLNPVYLAVEQTMTVDGVEQPASDDSIAPQAEVADGESSEGEEEPEPASGATDSMHVVHQLNRGLNAYGQYWQKLEPDEWTSVQMRSVDFGVHWENPEDYDDWLTRLIESGWSTRIIKATPLPQTGDLVAMLLLLLLIAAAAATAHEARRRMRRKSEAADVLKD